MRSERYQYRAPRGTTELWFPVLTLLMDAAAGLAALAVAGVGWGDGPLRAVPVGLAVLAAFSLYREKPELYVLDDAPRIAVALAMALATLDLLTLVPAWRTSGASANVRDASWLVVIGLWILFELVARRVSYSLISSLRTRRVLSQRTVIVGLHEGRDMARLLLQHPGYGLLPVGYVLARPDLAPSELDLPVLGPLAAVSRIVAEHRITHVIVGRTIAEEGALIAAIRECDRMHVEIFIVPGLTDLIAGAAAEHIRSIPILRMPRRAFRTIQWTVKRVMDFCVAGLTLLVLSPVIAIAAIAVTRETGGGMIFRQRRVGLDGREFEVLKLQTMVPASAADSAMTWNIADDDRVGPVGRFLRRTSLDELPQLWNVVRGDMSLVGPRPERPHFVEQFQQQYPRYLARHRVPCGVTGYAQIKGLRGDTSIAERIAYDNLYIEGWNLWLDLKILLRTIPAVLRGTGG